MSSRLGDESLVLRERAASVDKKELFIGALGSSCSGALDGLSGWAYQWCE